MVQVYAISCCTKDRSLCCGTFTSFTFSLWLITLCYQNCQPSDNPCSNTPLVHQSKSCTSLYVFSCLFFCDTTHTFVCSGIKRKESSLRSLKIWEHMNYGKSLRPQVCQQDTKPVVSLFLNCLIKVFSFYYAPTSTDVNRCQDHKKERKRAPITCSKCWSTSWDSQRATTGFFFLSCSVANQNIQENKQRKPQFFPALYTIPQRRTQQLAWLYLYLYSINIFLSKK